MGPMRWTRPCLALALALAGGAGCSGGAVQPEVLRAWVGRPAAALQQEWGPATREIVDGDLRILVYEQVEKRTGSDFQSPTVGRTSGGPAALAQAQAAEAYRSPTVYVRSYLFWVNREGTIVHSDVRQP